jgi:hypothetical protein
MFRKHAEECRKLALQMPQHKEALLRMMEAWIACADDAERRRDAEGEARSTN